MVFYVMRVKVVIILKPEVIGIATRSPTAMNQNLKNNEMFVEGLFTPNFKFSSEQNKCYNMQY
jgi:hypothetical protein